MIRVKIFEYRPGSGVAPGCSPTGLFANCCAQALGALVCGLLGTALAWAQIVPPSSDSSLSAGLGQEGAQDHAQRALLLEKVGHQKSLLKAQMDAVEAEFSRQMQMCSSRFAVTGCQLDAQTQRIDHLRPFKEEMVSLDDLERAIKAQDSLEALSEKQSAQAQARENARMMKAQNAYDERLAQHQKVLLDHDRQATQTPKSPTHPSEPSPSLGEQSQAQEAYERKLANAREHQAQVQKRLSEKTLHPKPLPTFEELQRHQLKSAEAPPTANSPTTSSNAGRTP
jgi:hypothetical protein